MWVHQTRKFYLLNFHGLKISSWITKKNLRCYTLDQDNAHVSGNKIWVFHEWKSHFKNIFKFLWLKFHRKQIIRNATIYSFCQNQGSFKVRERERERERERAFFFVDLTLTTLEKFLCLILYFHRVLTNQQLVKTFTVSQENKRIKFKLFLPFK